MTRVRLIRHGPPREGLDHDMPADQGSLCKAAT